MKKSLSLVVVTCLALALAACTAQTTSESTSAGVPAADEKSGDTVKTGMITESNGTFFLTESGQSPKQIESYAVDLSAYAGQTVTVTGQYSGDTLFVGKVE